MHKREPAELLIGDIAVFIISLWLTLALRYFRMPDGGLFLAHLAPFSFLFVVWVLVFFISGLYDKPIILLKRELASKVWGAHLINLIIAIIFFYTVPYFGIAPKVTLFLYLVISSVLIACWRFVLYPQSTPQKKMNAVLIGSGTEINELRDSMHANENAGMHFIETVDPKELNSEGKLLELKQKITHDHVSVVAIDLLNKDVQVHFASLYDLIFKGIQFIDTHDLYEDLFDREPLGLIDESWFLEHISLAPNFLYDILKRLMDIAMSLPMALVSLVFYPFVWAAIKLEDGGSIFIFQQRVGEKNKPMQIVKFRTMTSSDNGMWVMKEGEKEKRAMRITKVGKFLRTSRIDELPQLWNVLKGDISLIGPRPELPDLVEYYTQEIPYYNVRHLIKPGLSGWAQIHHEVPPHSVEETKVKLAYDLYYIKHRSFMLDVKIALQTVKTLLSRTGI